MLIDRLSSPSTGAATMVRPIAVPSLPLAVRTVPVRTAASATGVTGTAMSALEGVETEPSELVTTTCSVPEVSAEGGCRARSEEGRGGEEGRARGAADHLKKKGEGRA